MRVDEAKEAVLISSFTQAKEENFRDRMKWVLLFVADAGGGPLAKGTTPYLIVTL